MTTVLPLLAVRIPGRPHGQGSMNLYAVNGHAHGDYPEQTKSYRNTVVDQLRAEWNSAPPHPGPVHVRATAWMPRPAHHWLPANSRRTFPALRPGAPQQCCISPDLDKICRLVGDALQAAGILRDDRQICHWTTSRRWAGHYDDPGSLTIALDAIPTDRP